MGTQNWTRLALMLSSLQLRILVLVGGFFLLAAVATVWHFGKITEKNGVDALERPVPQVTENLPTAIAAMDAPPKTIDKPFPSPPVWSPVQANFETIFRQVSAQTRWYKVQGAENVFLIDFASLEEQAAALNRVGTLIEEYGMPRDRVLSLTEMHDYLVQQSLSAAEYFHGHNYRARHLAKFFTLVEKSGLALNSQETLLRKHLLELGILEKENKAYQVSTQATALLSVSQVKREGGVDRSLRYSVLLHELSHGAFFTDAHYSRYVKNFWQSILSESEKIGFKQFIRANHQDINDTELLANEMQAYLFFTPDKRMFHTSAAGLTDDRASELRKRFFQNMPFMWFTESFPVLVQSLEFDVNG